MLVNQGLEEEGIAAMKRAVDLEPLSPFMFVNLSTILNAVGQPRAAVEAARKAVALEPENPIAHFLYAGSLWDAGDAAGSYQALVTGPLAPMAPALEEAYEEGGIDAVWGRVLQLVIRQTGDPCGGVNGPGMHARVGDRERALSCLEDAVEVPGRYVNLYVKVQPMFEPLRREPRFQAVLAGMKLAD